MPNVPKGMNLSAKLRNLASEIITGNVAAAISGPQLYHAVSDIIIEAIHFECTTDFATEAGTFQVGKAGSAAFYGNIVAAVTLNKGDYQITGSTISQRRVPAGTAVQFNHIDKGTGAGAGRIHVWYYLDGDEHAVEAA